MFTISVPSEMVCIDKSLLVVSACSDGGVVSVYRCVPCLPGELISTLRGHQKGVWAVAFYPVGHTSALLATGGEDCTAKLWDTRTRKVALSLNGGHADAV